MTTVDRYVRLGTAKCLDPAPIADALAALGCPTDAWGRANSIACPVGMDAGSAWLVVTRATGAALAKNAFHSIT